MRERPAEILAQAGADLLGEGAWHLQPSVELGLVFRQPEGFQLRRTACCVVADQHEVARVGHQHNAVAAAVTAHLIARRRHPGVVTGRLHLHDAALWCLPLTKPAFLDLPRRVEAEIRMTGALVGQFADAEYLRLEQGT